MARHFSSASRIKRISQYESCDVSIVDKGGIGVFVCVSLFAPFLPYFQAVFRDFYVDSGISVFVRVVYILCTLWQSKPQNGTLSSGLSPDHLTISLENSSMFFRTEHELVLLLKTLRCYATRLKPPIVRVLSLNRLYSSSKGNTCFLNHVFPLTRYITYIHLWGSTVNEMYRFVFGTGQYLALLPHCLSGTQRILPLKYDFMSA